ncbi:hypothetical protein [Komagataeibacter sp. NFXK3]
MPSSMIASDAVNAAWGHNPAPVVGAPPFRPQGRGSWRLCCHGRRAMRLKNILVFLPPACVGHA